MTTITEQTTPRKTTNIHMLLNKSRLCQECEDREEYFRRQRSCIKLAEQKIQEHIAQLDELIEKIDQERAAVKESERVAKEYYERGKSLYDEARQMCEDIANITAAKDAENARLKEELARLRANL